MRTVKIQGGLGNQLFGLAFARSLRLATGDPVALDVASYRWDKYGRRFMIGEMAERIGGLPVVERPLLGNRLTSAAMRLAPFDARVFTSETLPPPDGFDMALYARRRGYFDGYWQDEAYILDGETWPALFGDFVRARTEEDTVGEVVIHYRTYKEENHPVFSRAPGRDYFLAAIAAVEAESGPVQGIVLVSDDTDLALERIGDLGRPIVARGRGGWADDMALMLNARALILTNSSFSWWAGYCGRAGVVAYPSRGRLFHYPIPARRFILCRDGHDSGPGRPPTV